VKNVKQPEQAGSPQSVETEASSGSLEIDGADNMVGIGGPISKGPENPLTKVKGDKDREDIACRIRSSSKQTLVIEPPKAKLKIRNKGNNGGSR